MNRSLAQWLADNPGGAVAAAGFLAVLPFFGFGLVFFLIGAVPAYLVLARGPRVGFLVGLGTALITAATAAAIGRSPVFGLLYSAWVLVPPIALSVLLARTGSLSMCLQVATLIAVAMLVGMHVLLGQPEKFFSPFIQDLAQQFQSQGVPQEDANNILSTMAKTLWGSIAVVAMLGAVLSVFVARWMQAFAESAERPALDPVTVLAAGLLVLVAVGATMERSIAMEIVKNFMVVVLLVVAFALPRKPTAYSGEFHEVRLGLALAAVTLAVAAASFLVRSAVVADVAGLFLCAFMVVGFSAAHRAKVRGTVGTLALATLYVLTLLLAPIMVLVMAAWGFVENWLRSQRAAPVAS
ncbi:MAG TPA: hypothetical protein VF851_05580 [Steroidobacteraceae bacterium]